MNYFSIMPDALRGIAGFLIQKCAQEQGGLGGYITLHFSAAEEWLESLAQSVTELRLAFNSTSTFFMLHFVQRYRATLLCCSPWPFFNQLLNIVNHL